MLVSVVLLFCFTLLFCHNIFCFEFCALLSGCLVLFVLKNFVVTDTLLTDFRGGVVGGCVGGQYWY